MPAELLKIEKILHVTVAKPLAWLVYGCWLGIVFLATATIWMRRRLKQSASAK